MSLETEEIKNEKPVNYMPIVRGMIKMSSALNESDSVMSGKYFKFEFKLRFKDWLDVFERSSGKLMKSFMAHNEEALQDAYTRFLEFTKDIKVKNQDRTDLILLYCKLKSAYNDLSEVNVLDGGLMTMVVKHCTEKVLEAIERQYADILNIRDVDGNSIQVIIDQFDELGKVMFVKD